MIDLCRHRRYQVSHTVCVSIGMLNRWVGSLINNRLHACMLGRSANLQVAARLLHPSSCEAHFSLVVSRSTQLGMRLTKFPLFFIFWEYYSHFLDLHFFPEFSTKLLIGVTLGHVGYKKASKTFRLFFIYCIFFQFGCIGLMPQRSESIIHKEINESKMY